MRSCLVYDTGALLAAERQSRAMRAIHESALGFGITPVVPTVVLAQAWRGGPQASLSLMLKGCDIVDIDESLARNAGKACGLASTNDVVDAVVVVLAKTLKGFVITSDPDDLRTIATALDFAIELESI